MLLADLCVNTTKQKWEAAGRIDDQIENLFDFFEGQL